MTDLLLIVLFAMGLLRVIVGCKHVVIVARKLRSYCCDCLRRVFRALGDFFTRADLWLVEYENGIKTHREEFVVPFLGKWMTETLGAMTFQERSACQAVYDVSNKVGLRVRCAASVESIGRHVRAKLVELGVEEEDVCYWGEMCTQMYFNPPMSVKAAAGRIEGFQ